MKEKTLKISGISIWRLLAYFIIYSFAGFIVETIFAFVVYGVIESRQSFLYGPFCSIYGLGAVVMICTLQYFKKDVHTLFLGGFLVGSVTEYVVSFIGEKLLNAKWWDYSERFLNLNGRICLLYSIFWGLLGIYLIHVLNPKIDKIIDWTKTKINLKALKSLTAFMTVFLFLDCVISGVAVTLYQVRVAVNNDLNIENKENCIKTYNNIYRENEKTAEFIYKYFGDEKMVKTYPNLTLRLATGEYIYLRDYFPDIQRYYYKFDRE